MAGKGKAGHFAKKTKKVNPRETVTMGAIRRLARRGGVKRISATSYAGVREFIDEFITKIVRDSNTFAEGARRKTITAIDVVYAVKRSGRQLYGYGAWSSNPTLLFLISLTVIILNLLNIFITALTCQTYNTTSFSKTPKLPNPGGILNLKKSPLEATASRNFKRVAHSSIMWIRTHLIFIKIMKSDTQFLMISSEIHNTKC